MICASDDVADAHVDVVHHDAEMVCRMFVGSQQYEILDRIALDGDFTEHRVLVLYGSFRNSETNSTFIMVRITAGHETVGGFVIQIQPPGLIVRALIPLK